MPQVFSGRASLGSEPEMNHSFTDSAPARALDPVQGSIAVRVRPSGRANRVTGHFRLASWRNPCQT
jgi:hypothetical protein